MKKDIHPNYTANAKIACACGTVYEIGSTNPDIQVELCAACHPFYTGKQRLSTRPDAWRNSKSEPR